jgi:hypothetical protein
MKSKLRAFFVLTLIVNVMIAGSPTFAHHGNRAAYAVDAAQELTVMGTVTQFKWGNPHVYVLYDVTDDRGNVAHWAAETRPPYVMAKSGWTRETLKPGDKITITVFPARAGAPVGLLAKVVFGGKLIYDDEQERLASGPQ